MDVAYLRAVLHYDPKTGVFTRKGKPVGTINAKGYRYISAGGKLYRANRLAWFYVHGEWPKAQIDHINGQRADDRIANLRDVSGHVNQRNRLHGNKGSSSPLRGVSFHKGTGKWRAQLSINRVTKHLGLFSTEIAAHRAYLKELAKCLS